MHRLVIVALGAMLFWSQAEAQVKNTIEEIVRRDTWSVAEGQHNGKPLVIRFRQDFREHPDLSAYSQRVLVKWSFQSDNSGMPDGETSFAMGEFEDRLVEAFEGDLSAVLTAVITNDGARQWLLYAKDPEIVEQRLAKLRDASFEADSRADPEWEFLYQRILGGME